jgi:hypothetical protein
MDRERNSLQRSRFNMPRLAYSLRQQIAWYIESCQLEDGGFFFARMPPSSAMDTYFAVKSLPLIGEKPRRPRAIVDYFLNRARNNSLYLYSLNDIFAAVEVMNELDQKMLPSLRNHAQQIRHLQNKTGGFGAIDNIDIEVPSELETTYRAIRILRIISTDFDEQNVICFVSSLLNQDGGYGKEGHSSLASTFYAAEIHKLLGIETRKLTSTRDYLRDKEDKWRANFDKGQVDFIENLFWLVKGLANMGEKSNIPERITEFVMACQRANGGFARATIMGIPTLEYTFYALSILYEIDNKG